MDASPPASRLAASRCGQSDPWKVQAQFLIEALVLSMLGGIAGVLAGIGAVRLTSSLAGWHVLISIPSLLVAFSVSLGVGLFFGY